MDLTRKFAFCLSVTKLQIFSSRISGRMRLQNWWLTLELDDSAVDRMGHRGDPKLSCWLSHVELPGTCEIFIWGNHRKSQAKPIYQMGTQQRPSNPHAWHHGEIHAKLCWTFRLATFKQSDLFIQMWLHSWKEFVQKTSLTLICDTLRPNHQLQKLVQICSHCVQTI